MCVYLWKLNIFSRCIKHTRDTFYLEFGDLFPLLSEFSSPNSHSSFKTFIQSFDKRPCEHSSESLLLVRGSLPCLLHFVRNLSAVLFTVGGLPACLPPNTLRPWTAQKASFTLYFKHLDIPWAS